MEFQVTPEQIAAKRRELEDARRALEHEQAELDAVVEPAAHARARKVGRRIETNVDGCPLFEQASQCVAAAALISRKLPQPSTPEERRV